ncbi:acyltransferase family protein [Candidatus Colwellia aromaticivorans]|uniref:acyltransferase family protein n=1 Tax=Candidatus Colwellia aromaticivorans TaxID=2267621 RepID=UPI000DF2EC31|nr:acyltransferase [Candidatus Colwellia aromaticivorans]
MITKKYIPSLHAFRGFAIINIVAIHAIEFIFFFAGTAETTPKPDLTPFAWGESILFHDSTLYFTFISAILFSLILAERGYANFFKSKLTNVFLPYLFFTSIVTWRNWGMDGTLTIFDGSLMEFTTLVGKNLITGGAIFSFWYIPVLFVLYLATPIFAKLLTIKKVKWVVVLLILAPLVCSRAWPDITWTNFAYFLGAYMLGMVVGANYRKTIELTERYLFLVALMTVASTAVLVGLFYLESPKWGVIIFTESAWYVQKIAIAGLVILLFERTMSSVPKWLDVLGNYAFSIYFLHGYLLFEMYEVMAKIITAPTSLSIILPLAILNVVLVISISVLITYAFKLLLGKYSRSIVGT